MVDIDLELEGLSRTQAALERLRERWDGPAEVLVFSRADYSQFLEFGRGPVEPDTAEALRFEVDGEVVYAARAKGHEPYPFFGPAIREFQAGPERFIRETTGRPLDSIRSLDDLMRTIGDGLETKMKANATAQQAGGRSPGTHPEHPKVQTGSLRRQIGYIVIGV